MFNRVGQIVKPIFMADGSLRILLAFGEVPPEEVANVARLMSSGNVNVFLAPEKDINELRKHNEEGAS